MEHSLSKPLHLDTSSFVSLMQATSEALSIPISLVEKDYYICLILRKLSESNNHKRIVFKGGTSLSKAYRLIDRFSEDVDFAVIHDASNSGNQVKMLLSSLMKEITTDFTEDTAYPDVSKGSRFRKQAFSYTSQLGSSPLANLNPIPSRIVVEISSFANPFPHRPASIEPFVTTFLKNQGLDSHIHAYGLNDFSLNVLSLEQTLCEKMVSLIRASMNENPQIALASKVRHFYDLNALMKHPDIVNYIRDDAFRTNFRNLVMHDKGIFSEPSDWTALPNTNASPIFNDFPALWRFLSSVYIRDLSVVAYREIPTSEEILSSFSILLEQLAHLPL